MFGAPAAVRAAAISEMADGRSKIGRVSLGAVGGLGEGMRKGMIDCKGRCYFAPEPVTQSTIAVYHSR